MAEADQTPQADEAATGDEAGRTDTSAQRSAPDLARPLILGRKAGMLQHFRANGSVVGATVIVAPSSVITQVRTKERDGYTALQLGFGEVARKKLSRAELGHLKDNGALKHLREVRVDDVDGFEAGQRIGVERFQPGDRVTVVGTSKGKGFQGPVHLHHFSRGPKSHGSDHLRRQGSVGSGTTPGRVLKGLRMAAHQGVDRVTVRNLVVLKSDPDRSLLVLSGAVPGARNGIVMVRKA